jgi:hypothetical protein
LLQLVNENTLATPCIETPDADNACCCTCRSRISIIPFRLYSYHMNDKSTHQVIRKILHFFEKRWLSLSTSSMWNQKCLLHKQIIFLSSLQFLIYYAFGYPYPLTFNNMNEPLNIETICQNNCDSKILNHPCELIQFYILN